MDSRVGPTVRLNVETATVINWLCFQVYLTEFRVFTECMLRYFKFSSNYVRKKKKKVRYSKSIDFEI